MAPCVLWQVLHDHISNPPMWMQPLMYYLIHHLTRKTFAPSLVNETASSYREKQEVAQMLSHTLSTPLPPLEEQPNTADDFYRLLSAVPTIDTEQHLDIYESEIDAALKLMGIAGIPALREHQTSAITHALNNEHLFPGLATKAFVSRSLPSFRPAAARRRSPLSLNLLWRSLLARSGPSLLMGSMLK